MHTPEMCRCSHDRLLRLLSILPCTHACMDGMGIELAFLMPSSAFTKLWAHRNFVSESMRSWLSLKNGSQARKRPHLAWPPNQATCGRCRGLAASLQRVVPGFQGFLPGAFSSGTPEEQATK